LLDEGADASMVMVGLLEWETSTVTPDRVFRGWEKTPIKM
jgi:hypothetical protein